MNEINKEILDKYLVRKTYKQKTEFINFLSNKLVDTGYSLSKQNFRTLWIKGRNLIVGDPYKAKYIISAHYDTQATMGPIPNFCAPLNKGITFLYQFILGLLMAVISLIIVWPIAHFVNNIGITLSVLAVILFSFSWLVMFGPANKNTYNDNTSGVTTLIDLMLKMKDEKTTDVCFVFFDLEEIGLVGSRLFLKTHKDIMKDIVLVNIDCVSDGTKMLGICNNIKIQQIPKNDYIYYDKKKAIYPSDQKGYPNYIAYCSLCESKRGILYLSRIHTKRDVIYKEENIDKLTDYLQSLIRKKDLDLINDFKER